MLQVPYKMHNGVYQMILSGLSVSFFTESNFNDPRTEKNLNPSKWKRVGPNRFYEETRERSMSRTVKLILPLTLVST